MTRKDSDVDRTALALIACVMLAVPAVHAQDKWPAKTIRIVANTPPGGPVDLLARELATGLQKRHGATAIVENHPGGNGIIGVDNVRRSAPDGHSFLVAGSGYFTIQPTLMKDRLPYDVARDLAPVSMLAKAPNLMVAHPSAGVSNVKEIVALAKSKKGALFFASPGAGTSLHLAGELFSYQTGVDLEHVAYKGTAPAMNDLLGGQVPLMFGNLLSLLPHVRAGKLRAIGLSDTSRSSVAPDIPTLAEQGATGVVAVSWYGLLAPAGTPTQIVNTVAKDAAAILNVPEVQQQMEKRGLSVWLLNPDAFRDLIAKETAGWARIIKERKIVAE
jgi:tripartite-type tricarboxylate transporter receptor subunit TctC